MQTLNWEFLNDQFDGDSECIDEVLEIFVESADETVGILKNAMVSANENELAGSAHKLKGAAGMIGGEKLSEQCLVVDKLCKAGNFSDAFVEAEKIPALYYELKTCIENY